ncbi:MAG: hypothetical protein ACREE6_14790 [Limisphaerales bacterium]
MKVEAAQISAEHGNAPVVIVIGVVLALQALGRSSMAGNSEDLFSS